MAIGERGDNRRIAAPACSCLLSKVELDEVANMRLMAVQIYDRVITINTSGDLLEEMCSAVLVKNPRVFKSYIVAKNLQWLKRTPSEMVLPKRLANRCFVDVGGGDRKNFIRTKVLLHDFRWSPASVILKYQKADGIVPESTPPVMPESCRPINVLDRVKADILCSYSDGFDFKETSAKLISARIGMDLSLADIEPLKKVMFKRTDNVWFLPEMITTSDTIEAIDAKVWEYLRKYGVFAVEALYKEFAHDILHLPDLRNFRRFLTQIVLGNKPKVNILKANGWYVCYTNQLDESEIWSTIGNYIHEEMSNVGDAISIDDLAQKLPFLSSELIEYVGKEKMADVIYFELDGVKYLKLLQDYYLPETFSDVLEQLVQDIESSNGLVSVVLLEEACNNQFGVGFRTNYGLDDDNVFKQIISKSYDRNEYVWKYDMFVDRGMRNESNLVDNFTKIHDLMFHEEEFFKYAKETRNLTNRGMLILTFLRRYCIRLTKEWWVSQNGFDNLFGVSEEKLHLIGDMLNNVVGTNAFRSIAKLPQTFYDELPEIRNNGQPFRWNAYLLTSIATHRIKNVVVVNDEPSPYTVTSIVVPRAYGRVDDVVEYVIKSFDPGYFVDADAAFEYLKENNIRLTRTKKLMQKLDALIGR